MNDLSLREPLMSYLIQCCYWYYVKANPIEQDTVYDHLFHQLQAIEHEVEIYPEESPTQKIWGEREEEYPEWAKSRESLKPTNL